MAGIVNTALRKSVRTSTVFGLGVSAVSDEGLGILHKLPIREGGNRVGNNMNFYTGKLNVDDVHCIDLTTGNLVRLRGQDAAELSLDRPVDKPRKPVYELAPRLRASVYTSFD